MQTELMLLDEKAIKEKMYYIRGEYTMIDSDLVKIYGYTQKHLINKYKEISKNLIMILCLD